MNRRERTVAELQARLERAELSARAIEAAVAELCELGYVEDARYARLFAQDKRALAGWGRERIARVLRERGVAEADIDAALAAEATNADSELDRAVALLEQRLVEPPRDLRQRERALALLLRRGYDSETAYDAVRIAARGAAPTS